MLADKATEAEIMQEVVVIAREIVEEADDQTLDIPSQAILAAALITAYPRKLRREAKKRLKLGDDSDDEDSFPAAGY